VPFSAGSLKQPVPPGIPSPGVLVPLIPRGMRSMFVERFRQRERAEVVVVPRNLRSSTGLWLRGRLGNGLWFPRSTRPFRHIRARKRRAHIRPARSTALSMSIVLHITPLWLLVAGGSNLSRPQRAPVATVSTAARLFGEAERSLVVVVLLALGGGSCPLARAFRPDPRG